MRRHPIRILLPLLLAVLMCLPMPVQAAKKQMQGDYADFYIVLDEEGGATVTETWGCQFSGDTISRFRKFYTLPEPWSMELEVMEVLMDGEPMTLLDAPDKQRPEGCAAVFSENGQVTLEMYLRALNQSHEFVITYYVTNAVQVFNDAAEFHWNLTSEKESFDIAYMTGVIEIPYGTRDKGLYFWGHGPNNGSAWFEAVVDEDGMVNRFELYNEDIPMDRAVTVRFAMPRELFPGGTRGGDYDILQDILAEESGHADISGSVGETIPVPTDIYEEPQEELSWWQKLSNRLWDVGQSITFFVTGLLRLVALAVAFVPPIMLIFFHRIFQKEAEKKYLPQMYAKHRKRPAEAPQYYRSLPDDLKPAMVYKLMGVYPSSEEGKEALAKGNSYSATVLDLVERGLLKLIPGEELRYLVTPEASQAVLTDYEKNIVDLYKAAGADQEPRTTEEITAYMREEYSWCKAHYREFYEQVDADFKEMAVVRKFTWKAWDQQKHLRVGIFFGLIVAVGLLPGSGLFSSAMLGAVSGFINSLVFHGIDNLRHPDFDVLTQEGEDRYALWKAYGDFLRDFTVFEERNAQDVTVWRKYLVYATALGCSEKVVEQLRLREPQVYSQLMQNYDPTGEVLFYDDILDSISSIDTENGYTIRSQSNSGWSSDSSSDWDGDSGWGGFSDDGGDSDSGSSGSDFD